MKRSLTNMSVFIMFFSYMTTFVLKTGQVVAVDAEDLARISLHKWHIMGNGYAGRCWRENKKVRTQYLHHFIFGNVPQIDHVNGNRLDNRKFNLRVATYSQNQGNSRVRKRPKTSFFKGIYWNKSNQRWHVQIGSPRQYLGSYRDEVEAAKVYDTAAHRRWGQFAKLNLGVW